MKTNQYLDPDKPWPFCQLDFHADMTTAKQQPKETE